jgi:hypothetical protein
VIVSGVEDALRPASSPLHVVLARRRLSVMVLQNSHRDTTRISAALSMIEIFQSE